MGCSGSINSTATGGAILIGLKTTQSQLHRLLHTLLTPFPSRIIAGIMNKFMCVALGLCVAMAAISQAEGAIDEAEFAKALGQEKPDASSFCWVMRDEVGAFLRRHESYARLFNLMYEHMEKMFRIKDAYGPRRRRGQKKVVVTKEYGKQVEEQVHKLEDALEDDRILKSVHLMFFEKLLEIRDSLEARLWHYQDEKLPRGHRYLRNTGCALGDRIDLALLASYNCLSKDGV